jgi:photosystem II stability/assembly factor-like uncharacterized protein
MRTLICAIFIFGLCCSGRAQVASRVYPDKEHNPLFGVVTTHDGTLYAAGANNTFLRSTDSGDTWAQLSTGNHRLHITKIVTDGTDLYMMAIPYLHSGRPDLVHGFDPFALYKYETRSNTFRHIPIPVPERTDSTQINLYSLAATPDALYLSYNWDSRGNLVSTDRGITWNELDVPDSLGENQTFQFYTGSDSNDIVVVAPDGLGRKFAIGRDGGKSWKQLDGPIVPNIDYAESAVLYLGDDRILIHARETGALMMNDTTGEWSVVGYPPFKDISALALSPSGSIIMCSDKGGIFSSDDDGESWTMLHADYNTKYKLEYDLGFFGSGGIVAVNTMGEIYITHDLGTSWELPRETPFVVSRLIWAEDDRAVVTMAHWKTWDYSEYITNDGYRSFQQIDDILDTLFIPFQHSSGIVLLVSAEMTTR